MRVSEGDEEVRRRWHSLDPSSLLRLSGQLLLGRRVDGRRRDDALCRGRVGDLVRTVGAPIVGHDGLVAGVEDRERRESSAESENAGKPVAQRRVQKVGGGGRRRKKNLR